MYINSKIRLVPSYTYDVARTVDGRSRRVLSSSRAGVYWRQEVVRFPEICVEHIGLTAGS